MRAPSARSLWLAGLVLTLGWGAGAFGSNYPWAYTPLLAAGAAMGIGGLVLGRDGGGPIAPIAICLGAVAVAVATQLVPISRQWLATLSPHADLLLRQHDLGYAMQDGGRHALSIDPLRTQLGLAFLAGFGVLLLGTARGLRRDTSLRLASLLVVLGVVLAFAGMVQRATFTGKIYGFWQPLQGGSPFGPFVNRNHFAGWMLMGLPVAIGLFSAMVSRGMRGIKPGLRNRLLWFSSPDASRAVLVGFAVLVMALSLVLTMSRSGIVGLAVALCLTAIAMARQQPSAGRRLVVGGYLLLVAIVVVLWVGLDRIAARFGEGDMVDASGRQAIWGDTLRIARDFWLTGTGLNTYGVSTLYYQTALPDQHLREAHSDYLQLAAEGGLLLGIPIVVTIGLFVRQVRARLREDVGSIWWVRMGAVVGLLAIAIQSTVEFSLQMPGNAALFAVLGGLVLHADRSDGARS